MQEKLKLANELAQLIEREPMFALGIAAMNEDLFITIAIRAKHILMARASKAGIKLDK